MFSTASTDYIHNHWAYNNNTWQDVSFNNIYSQTSKYMHKNLHMILHCIHFFEYQVSIPGHGNQVCAHSNARASLYICPLTTHISSIHHTQTHAKMSSNSSCIYHYRAQTLKKCLIKNKSVRLGG